MKEEVCTSRKAAEILGVTPRTIQLWADAGILQGWKTPGGHRRFNLSEIQQLALSIRNPEEMPPLSNTLPTQVQPVKVLVVDDDKTIRRLYELTLASWGLPMVVHFAADGYEGLIEVGRQAPDLMILDLQMPNIDGFAVIRALEQQSLLTQMKLMVVSALSEEDVKANIALPESVTFIQKPIPFARIRDEVERILLSS
ncbi:response regulator [Nitrincola tapanii]|uniref:Response regulator n=1 Tax=Nitrincola tapanii TaxID=1708751 RepID=A0A5A9W5Q7_9GAMM|nr:response regulator [Nitrincola tapanii]KAA0875419.1 response regulator [Nitrincola tapanii]